MASRQRLPLPAWRERSGSCWRRKLFVSISAWLSDENTSFLRAPQQGTQTDASPSNSQAADRVSCCLGSASISAALLCLPKVKNTGQFTVMRTNPVKQKLRRGEV